MNEPETGWVRERALFRYSTALARADFETIAAVWEAAETDPELEQMLRELNEAYAVEQPQMDWKETADLVQGLLRTHLPTCFAEQDAEVDAPPITVGDVLGSLKTNAVHGPSANDADRLAQQSISQQTPVPEDLSRPAIRRLFEQLGMAVGRPFLDLFRDTAIRMVLHRDQEILRLAATRRQNERPRPDQKDDTPS
jgi:hypothetical protein